MEERKGLFTPEQETKLASLADEAVQTNGIVEAVDGVVFKAAISLLDNLVFNKLPEGTKDLIIPITDEIIEAL